MRVLVCGGRTYRNVQRVQDVLTELHLARRITLIIEGGASGADAMAWRWAVVGSVPSVQRKADWKKHGKAAGPIRNREILERDKPDLVVAFPGGPGTAHMVKIAREAGVEVMEVIDG